MTAAARSYRVAAGLDLGLRTGAPDAGLRRSDRGCPQVLSELRRSQPGRRTWRTGRPGLRISRRPRPGAAGSLAVAGHPRRARPVLPAWLLADISRAAERCPHSALTPRPRRTTSEAASRCIPAVPVRGSPPESRVGLQRRVRGSDPRWCNQRFRNGSESIGCPPPNRWPRQTSVERRGPSASRSDPTRPIRRPVRTPLPWWTRTLPGWRCM